MDLREGAGALPDMSWEMAVCPLSSLPHPQHPPGVAQSSSTGICPQPPQLAMSQLAEGGLPKVPCTLTDHFTSACIKACLYLRLGPRNLYGLMGKQHQSSKSWQYGSSSHSACIPTAARSSEEKCVGVWGKGKQRSAEAVEKLHSCKRNHKARGTSTEHSTVMMKQVIKLLQILGKSKIKMYQGVADLSYFIFLWDQNLLGC